MVRAINGVRATARLEELEPAARPQPRGGSGDDPDGVVVPGGASDSAVSGRPESGRRGTYECPRQLAWKLALARDPAHALRQDLQVARTVDKGHGKATGR